MEPRFWDEPDFETWKPNSRLLYLWAMTNPSSHGITGTMQATPSKIKLQTGLTPKALERAFEEIGPRIRHYENGWLWLCARFTHQRDSDNHAKSAVYRILERAIPRQLAIDFLDRYGADPVIAKVIEQRGGPLKALASPREGPSIPHRTPTPTPTPNRLQEESDLHESASPASRQADESQRSKDTRRPEDVPRPCLPEKYRKQGPADA